jgi:hypothetical protein
VAGLDSRVVVFEAIDAVVAVILRERVADRVLGALNPFEGLDALLRVLTILRLIYGFDCDSIVSVIEVSIGTY